MNRLIFSVLVFLSLPAFSDATYTFDSVLSYNVDVATFGEASSSDNSIKVEYKFVEVSSGIKESDFTFDETHRCTVWINQPGYPGDEGDCVKYELSGYSLKNLKNYDLFRVERTITNLQNGKVQHDVLSGKVQVYPFVDRSFPVNTDKSKLRLHENETFEAIIGDQSTFGCYGNNPFLSVPLLGEPANIGICSRLEGRAIIEKRGNKFSVILKGVPTYKLSAEAYWTVRDYPRKNLVTKKVWKNSAEVAGSLNRVNN